MHYPAVSRMHPPQAHLKTSPRSHGSSARLGVAADSKKVCGAASRLTDGCAPTHPRRIILYDDGGKTRTPMTSTKLGAAFDVLTEAFADAKVRGVPEDVLIRSLKRMASEVQREARLYETERQVLGLSSPRSPSPRPHTGMSYSGSLPALSVRSPVDKARGKGFSNRPSALQSPSTPKSPGKPIPGLKPWGLTPLGSSPGAASSPTHRSPQPHKARSPKVKIVSPSSPEDRRAQAARAAAHVIGALRQKVEQCGSASGLWELNRTQFCAFEGCRIHVSMPSFPWRSCSASLLIMPDLSADAAMLFDLFSLLVPTCGSLRLHGFLHGSLLGSLSLFLDEVLIQEGYLKDIKDLAFIDAPDILFNEVSHAVGRLTNGAHKHCCCSPPTTAFLLLFCCITRCYQDSLLTSAAITLPCPLLTTTRHCSLTTTPLTQPQRHY